MDSLSTNVIIIMFYNNNYSCQAVNTLTSCSWSTKHCPNAS